MGDPQRGQGRVLALLKMRPEISQKDLSYLLDIRPQSLGELLAKLERGGYITRTPSETDNRVMNIKLTEAGAEITEQQAEGVPDLFAELNAEEQGALSGYLARVIGGMEKVLGDVEPHDGPHHGLHGHFPHRGRHGHEGEEMPHGHDHPHHPPRHGHGPHARFEGRGMHGHGRSRDMEDGGGCRMGHARHGRDHGHDQDPDQE
jgi:Transcriptional regulators